MTSKSFFKGAFILSIAGLIVKVIGVLYRIPLARLIGEEGMGLYQMAYPVYAMLLTLSTAGFPVAISILVAENHAKGNYGEGTRIFRVSLAMLSITGLFFTLLMLTGAHWLAHHVFVNPKSFYGLVAIAPAIFLAAISSAYRGYFQGNQQMTPTALSQIVEQVVRVITILLLAYLLFPKGLEFAAAGATFGAVTGSAAALALLLHKYRQHKVQIESKMGSSLATPEPVPQLLKRILTLALPVTVGGLVVPIMQTIDAAIIPLRLQVAGYSLKRATELLGQFSGMANPLINIAPIITISISIALVPIISEAMAKNDMKEVSYRVNQALWSTFLIGMPSAAGLWVLATPISEMLFELPEMGPLVAMLTPSTLLLGLYQTTRGTLQGMGKTYLPVINLTIGVAIKGLLNFILVAIPALGIQGAGIATVTGFAVSVALNLYYVKKYTAFQLDWSKTILLPSLSALFMVVITCLVYQAVLPMVGNSISVILAILVGIISYSAAILFTGGVKTQDLQILPGIGPRLANQLGRFKRFRS